MIHANSVPGVGRKQWLAVMLGLGFMSAYSMPEATSVTTDPMSNPPQQQSQDAARPARDGDIAIREELEAAKDIGTPAAYQAFIDRHPNHALADEARHAIRDLESLGESRHPMGR